MRVALGLLVSLVMLLPACAPLSAPRPEQLSYPPLQFRLPEVERFELANGIRVYFKPDNEIPLVQVSAMVGFGELDASRELSGFDDLFAATWRTGGTVSTPAAELEERIDLLAANLAADMGPYSSQMNLSLRSADLEDGIAILADLLRRPAFRADKLELARRQAIERVRRQNDHPGMIGQRLLRAALYPGHPLGDSPTEASLGRIGRDDLVAFHDRYFAPNSLWLAVSGDVGRDDLVALLERHLGDWPHRELPAATLPPVTPPAAGAVLLARKEVPQTTVLVGDLGMTKEHPDQYAAAVFNFILGGGSFNSRLMREIRSDRGLAYSAYSYFQVGRRLPGPFVAGTETKSATTLEALRLIREIMEQMRAQPVSDEELRVAKESLINSFVFGFDDTHGVVSQRMNLDFFAYPGDYLERYRDHIAAVSVADVQRVAREFVRPDRQQIILVGNPDKIGEGLGTLGLPVSEVDPVAQP